ncbi:MAG: glycosyltransferase family 4 protein [Acidobacteria bacterium]|nr:glycosyltransferase family 4 protein [Acidobacteriota bacterium]
MPADLRTSGRNGRRRLAFVVTHPIQYYVPLYRLLAKRGDLEIKVFFTWHAGEGGQFDPGFQREIAWDIPLTEGYGFEAVTNSAPDAGPHRFGGIRCPDLAARVLAWRPDAVHLTGYAYDAHLRLLRRLRRRGVPVLFRGDSHLLDAAPAWKRLLKGVVLRRVFAWPDVFLFTGQHNRRYYEAFGVPAAKLVACPHSIEVSRFADNTEQHEREAAHWRTSLNLPTTTPVLLFAGKFEPKKRPVEFARAFRQLGRTDLRLVMLGDGPLRAAVEAEAAQAPELIRLLPFQNQSRMPVTYRLGDVFVLPSAHDETWGLAVNEALCCGRPVLVSDKVGCAPDVVVAGQNGEVFPADDWPDCRRALERLLPCVATNGPPRRFPAALRGADVPDTAAGVLRGLENTWAKPVMKGSC